MTLASFLATLKFGVPWMCFVWFKSELTTPLCFSGIAWCKIMLSFEAGFAQCMSGMHASCMHVGDACFMHACRGCMLHACQGCMLHACRGCMLHACRGCMLHACRGCMHDSCMSGIVRIHDSCLSEMHAWCMLVGDACMVHACRGFIMHACRRCLSETDICICIFSISLMSISTNIDYRVPMLQKCMPRDCTSKFMPWGCTSNCMPWAAPQIVCPWGCTSNCMPLGLHLKLYAPGVELHLKLQFNCL